MAVVAEAGATSHDGYTQAPTGISLSSERLRCPEGLFNCLNSSTFQSDSYKVFVLPFYMVFFLYSFNPLI
jgi:hypothetical protein